MKLLTKEILEAFREQGDCSKKEPTDIKIICKMFNPAGRGTWYCYEYDEKDEIFWAFVSIFNDHNDECGPVSKKELEDLKLPFGLGIERDMYFPVGKYTLKEVMDGKR